MFIQQEETMETITNWLTTEKEKIVEYQTQAWAEAKIQTANNAITLNADIDWENID